MQTGSRHPDDEPVGPIPIGRFSVIVVAVIFAWILVPLWGTLVDRLFYGCLGFCRDSVHDKLVMALG